MVILDVKDKKILYHLSENARISHTQLSKKVQLSKNAVKYRIERLQKESVITKFASVVNLGSLGLTTITLLLKFNEDIYAKPEMIEFFKKHRLADWVVTLSGQWDMLVEFVAKDFMSLYSIVNDITERFSNSLNSYQLFFSRDTLRVEHLIADFYSDLKIEQPVPSPRTAETHKIDDTDKMILRLLSKDSSLPYLQIARESGLTIDIVRYRIKSLMDKGILVKFFSEVSLPKLGYTEYLYTIKLKNISKEKMSSIKRSVQTNPNITYAFADINSFTIMFVCAFKTPEGIDSLSRSLRKKYPDIIEEQNYLIIKEQVLFNLFPDGI